MGHVTAGLLTPPARRMNTRMSYSRRATRDTIASHTHKDTLRRSIALGMLALACTACGTTKTPLAGTQLAAAQAAGRQLEALDRGVVAIPTQGGNFVSWRALAQDDPATAFNLYRDGKHINDKPLAATNFVDNGAGPAAAYSVLPVRGNAESSEGRKPVAAWLRSPVRHP